MRWFHSTSFFLAGCIGTILLLITVVPGRAAGPPSPGTSTVPSVFQVASNGAGANTITVRDMFGVLCVGVTVDVTLHPTVTASLCGCSATPLVLTGVTNNAGQFTPSFSGGGCFLAAALGGAPATVTASGIGIGTADLVSPDIIDENGNPPPPGGPCVFGLTDLVWLATNTGIFGGAASYHGCGDFNGSGTVDINDIVSLTPLIQGVLGCP